MSSDLLPDSRAPSASMPADQTVISPHFRTRGFLPETDPLTAFPPDSEFAALDELGQDLPSLLQDPGFRQYARTLNLPLWPNNRPRPEDLPGLRLYYVRVGFLASAFLGALGGFLIGEVAGLFLESPSAPFYPALGFLLWPVGAIALPVFLYRREKRRQKRP